MKHVFTHSQWDAFCATLIGIAFFAVLWPLASIDFWYDEVLSLEEFILVPIEKTLTHYPVPNNHIFFSLLMNLWLKLWNLNTFTKAIENVFLVRLLPMLFSLATLVMVYCTGKKFFSAWAGVLAMLVLATTVPFFNFALQIRGYALSQLLCSIGVYACLHFYYRPTKLKGVFIGIVSALLLYTLPSNLYALLSLLAILAIVYAWQLGRYNWRIALGLPIAQLFLWVLAGMFAGIFLYLPVWVQVISNDYVKSAGGFRVGIFSEALQFYIYLFSYRWWLLAVLPLPLFIVSKTKNYLPLWATLLALLILPFLISFVRGDAPFDRTFLWILPLFALLLGSWIASFFEYATKKHIYRWGLPFLCVGTLLVWRSEINTVNATLTNRLLNEEKKQDIYYNYYLHAYNPYTVLKYFVTKQYTDSTPVFLHEVDKYAMHGYLPALGINWQPYTDSIKTTNKYFIITAFPKKAKKQFIQYDSSFNFSLPVNSVNFVNIIEANRRK